MATMDDVRRAGRAQSRQYVLLEVKAATNEMRFFADCITARATEIMSASKRGDFAALVAASGALTDDRALFDRACAAVAKHTARLAGLSEED